MSRQVRHVERTRFGTDRQTITHTSFVFQTPMAMKGGPKVYDVTKYLDDHPGGAEVMLDVAGQDADEFFEDIGHSKDAREELKKYLIGDYKLDEATLKKMREEAITRESAKAGGSSIIMILVLLLAIAFGFYKTQMS